MKEPIAFENDPTIKIDSDGVAFSLRAREFKDPQCVVLWEESDDMVKRNRDEPMG